MRPAAPPISKSPHMKTILYDSYNISLPTGTGIATYARALVNIAPSIGYSAELLHEIQGDVPKNLELAKSILFEDREKKTTELEYARYTVEAFTTSARGARATRLPSESYLLENPIRNRVTDATSHLVVPNLFPRANRFFSVRGKLFPVTLDRPPDVAHFTFQLPVRIQNAPNIYTIHDLVPLILPYASLDNKRRSYKLFQEIKNTADHIVTVSEQSKADIIRALGVPEERVTNTYQAINIPEEAKAKSDQEIEDEISGLFSLGYRDYYLFFGAIEPKKNIRRLIEAYLSSRVKRPLVIVSSGGWQNKTELQIIKENPRRPDGSGITKLSYLPYEFLISLIRGARAVLFPSLYEGFGLPALEAMALGTPVLASNSSSLSEVAGDAAVAVDPISVRSIRDGILALDSDDGLLKELTGKGPEQAAKFSPEAYRKRLSALYDKVT